MLSFWPLTVTVPATSKCSGHSCSVGASAAGRPDDRLVDHLDAEPPPRGEQTNVVLVQLHRLVDCGQRWGVGADGELIGQVDADELRRSGERRDRYDGRPIAPLVDEVTAIDADHLRTVTERRRCQPAGRRPQADPSGDGVPAAGQDVDGESLQVEAGGRSGRLVSGSGSSWYSRWSSSPEAPVA